MKPAQRLTTGFTQNGCINKPLVWSTLLTLFILVSSCDFQSHKKNNNMPYQNEDHLTGQMLYKKGDYFYHKAKETHTYGGLPETDMAELEQAAHYYNKALAMGYHPIAGYDNLEEYYLLAIGDEVKQEAKLTALINAYPDNARYWYSRAMNRQAQKNYQGALQDLNQVINLDQDSPYLETRYYLRGAMKYMLNPQDTVDAEADRSIAQKLHKENTTLTPYHDYCSSW